MTGAAGRRAGTTAGGRPSPGGTRTARDVAFALLLAVEQDDAYANLALPKLLGASRLARPDRALATQLGYGAVREQGTLDHLVGLVSTRPVAELDPAVRAALRLGTYQLLRTRVAAHAAVDATVSLVRPQARGYVNAVLRAVATRCGGEDPLGLADVADPWDRLALQHAHPGWAVDAYRDALGGDPAEVEAALAEHPAVRDVAVIGLPDADWGKRVHAIIELGSDADPPSPDTLREHCRERLAAYKAPKSFEFIDRLPRDDAGKLRRSALVEQRS